MRFSWIGHQFSKNISVFIQFRQIKQVLENSSPYLSWPLQEGKPSFPELINRSYYLCSFTDDWLFGTDSANRKVLVFKPEQWECYLEGRKKNTKPWILLIDKSRRSPKGSLVHLSSWQVATQCSQDAKALPRSTRPPHILYPDPVISWGYTGTDQHSHETSGQPSGHEGQVWGNKWLSQGLSWPASRIPTRSYLSGP